MRSLGYEIDLLSRLVEINTESVSKSGYTECASIISEAAEQSSLDVEIVDGSKAANDGLSRPNVVVTLDSGSDVTLLLESHFDVVPAGSGWVYPPFRLSIDNGKAYGRGAADNKSGIAAAMGAMRLLRQENLDLNLKLIVGVDEEIGGKYGIGYVLDNANLEGDAAVVLDAGSERLYLGASGVIWGKVRVDGRSGHAGYPFRCKNAVTEAMKLLEALEPYKRKVENERSKLKAPPRSPREFVWGRFSVTIFRGGEKENVIPGACEFGFDRRLLPEESLGQAEEELLEYFNKAVEDSECEATLEILNTLEGYATPAESTFAQTVSEGIMKTTGHVLPHAAELVGNDGGFFARKGIPVVCYGTLGRDTNYHGSNEFVHIKDIKNARDLIVYLGKVDKCKIVGQ